MDKKEQQIHNDQKENFDIKSYNVKPKQSDKTNPDKTMTQSDLVIDTTKNSLRSRSKTTAIPFNKSMSFGNKDAADIEEDNAAIEDDLLDIVNLMKDYSDWYVVSLKEDNKVIVVYSYIGIK